MKPNFTLTRHYKWKVLTSDGLLKDPLDEWGQGDSLSRHFLSEEEAIEEYSRYVNNGFRCPNSMVLIQEHVKNLDWDS